MEIVVTQQWINPSWILLLVPFSIVFYFISFLYLAKKNTNSNVWIVGNAVVGGAGKTPVVQKIATWLLAKGKKVVILTRGYGRDNKTTHWVNDAHMSNEIGDEVVMLRNSLEVAIMVADKRMPAIEKINRELKPDIILCDDGLQHRGMQYNKAILLTSAYKNKLVLPAGPMRCSEAFLRKTADLIIDPSMLLSSISYFYSSSGEKVDKLPTNIITAVTGIARPERFFNLLEKMGYIVNRVALPDHHKFQKTDLDFSCPVIVVTEKDAVKIPPAWGKYFVAKYQVELTGVFDKLEQWLD